MRILPLCFSLLLALATLGVQANTLAEFKFDTPEQEQAFRKLTGELRCLVCQNESLEGSQAELAEDLRREVYEMMRSGKTKEEIVNFLVARYGDFVLYDPPLKASTWPIWFGPFILVAVGGFFLARTLLRKKQTGETELSAQDEERLKDLLADSSSKQESEK